MLGYHPQVILAGRRINDGMGKFIAEKTVKMMVQAGSSIKGAKVNVLGLTFKEDCPDLRNSKVLDIIHELESYGIDVNVHDPVADPIDAQSTYGLSLTPWELMEEAEAIILAVSHDIYRTMGAVRIAGKLRPGGVVADVKSIFNSIDFPQAGAYWRL